MVELPILQSRAIHWIRSSSITFHDSLNITRAVIAKDMNFAVLAGAARQHICARERNDIMQQITCPCSVLPFATAP
jgi:hypothetical protein